MPGAKVPSDGSEDRPQYENVEGTLAENDDPEKKSPNQKQGERSTGCLLT